MKQGLIFIGVFIAMMLALGLPPTMVEDPRLVFPVQAGLQLIIVVLYALYVRRTIRSRRTGSPFI